jgi:alpha-tubulin suppressor-like RCC1 family protein
MAWGYDYYGELGDGQSGNPNSGYFGTATPVPVSGLDHVTAIASCGGTTYALRSDGTVWAWGLNDEGQLGDGSNAVFSDVPAQVTGLANVTAIAAGVADGYALRSDGTVWSWGGAGALGAGSPATASGVPVQVTGISDARAIGSGMYTAYAVRANGTVLAWGDNTNGQLGDGSSGGSALTPVAIPNLSAVSSVTGGASDGYAVSTDGSVYAWGDDQYGELGDGNNTSTSTPAEISALSGITEVSAGDEMTYALGVDGQVWAWGPAGLDGNGYLGDSSAYGSHTPAMVPSLGSVGSIAAAEGDAYALVPN